MYAVDTHALLCHLQEMPAARGRRARGLSPRARRIFAAADRGEETILIPSIVLVELVYLSERGVVPGALVDGLIGDLARAPENYRLVVLDLETIIHLRDIPATTVPEMPDRIVAAAAKGKGVPLLTRDESISAAGIRVVW